MFYGIVEGTVVFTVKDPKLNGLKFMVVQKTNVNKEIEGSPIVAIDTVGAGRGDFVYLTKGMESALPLGGLEYPIDAAITGIIDKTIV